MSSTKTIVLAFLSFGKSRSISKNVGAMNKYLTKLISGKMYSTMKNKSLSFLEKMPRMHEFAKRSEEHLKGMVLPSTLLQQ
jgi:1-deoxy-D-xylulose-5-phosphate synthase